MENEIKEKFLPIGTVVLLKNGKRKLMITSYCPVPNEKVTNPAGQTQNSKNQMFDYGACIYPEGIMNSNQIFVFNHDQIDKICYMGYESDESKKFDEILKLELSKKESQE